jgi:hypothetical protein
VLLKRVLRPCHENWRTAAYGCPMAQEADQSKHLATARSRDGAVSIISHFVNSRAGIEVERRTAHVECQETETRRDEENTRKFRKKTYRLQWDNDPLQPPVFRLRNNSENSISISLLFPPRSCLVGIFHNCHSPRTPESRQRLSQRLELLYNTG